MIIAKIIILVVVIFFNSGEFTLMQKKSDPSDEGGFDIQYNGISEMKLPN